MIFKIFINYSKKNTFAIDAIKEYEKRLSRYCKIKCTWVKNGGKLPKTISTHSMLFQITKTGEHLTSEDLADKINALGIHGYPNLTFLIGFDEILGCEKICLSNMNMDPSLETVILYEQVYRAYRILNNEPYHK